MQSIERTLSNLAKVLLPVLAFGLVVGCTTPKAKAPAGKSTTAAAPQGATLWAQNCGFCHNSRSPDSLGNAQWDVVTVHMRLRANLTADDARQISAFLRSSH